jgi:hypothetical protein
MHLTGISQPRSPASSLTLTPVHTLRSISPCLGEVSYRRSIVIARSATRTNSGVGSTRVHAVKVASKIMAVSCMVHQIATRLSKAPVLLISMANYIRARPLMHADAVTNCERSLVAAIRTSILAVFVPFQLFKFP